jgi:23S rRNA pseudouridine2457 synthase
MFTYYSLYKPFGMLSQFTPEGNRQSLAALDFKFPKDVYPLGRLDAESEGLLLLTNDRRVNKKLLDPGAGHWRTYLVQVEGELEDEKISPFIKGMDITIEGQKYKTLPAKVKINIDLPDIPERNPPVRFRKAIPTSWMEISLQEGKNHQVRKMTAAIGYPTLRLIRTSIEDLKLTSMDIGKVVEIKKMDFYKLLKLKL